MNGNEGRPAVSLLGHYRVIELEGESVAFCGRLLAELGADVIKVERPCGDPSRLEGPYYQNSHSLEHSLTWFSHNRGKRGITLNLEHAEGRDLFRRLAATADFVLESFPPGYLHERGLGYADLSAHNPRLVMTSITPFGHSGPWKDWATADLIALALGGLLFMTGDPDRPPVRVSYPQAYALAGNHAAALTLIAHYHRQRTGQGQHVDVSIHESVVRTLMSELAFWEYARHSIERLGSKRHRANSTIRLIWECKDGYVSLYLTFGRYGSRLKPLAEWMDREGMAGALKEVKDWEKVDTGNMPPEQIAAWEEAIATFLRQHTKSELYEAALSMGLYLFPVNTIRDIREDRQLASRDFWQQVPHPELGEDICYPGPAFRSSAVPAPNPRRAPLLGEHNREVYGEALSLRQGALERLRREGVI